jgi:hypothetical protein
MPSLTGVIRSLDNFKIEHSFYVYKGQKSMGKRKYALKYGTLVGGLITLALFAFLFMYFYHLFDDMVLGKNDVLDEKFISNTFKGKDGFYNFNDSNSQVEAQLIVKAWDDKFWAEDFDIFNDEGPINTTSYLIVNATKLMKYIMPVAFIE